MDDIKAIDYLNYYYTPEAKRSYETLQKDEIVCRMEASVGGFPDYSPQQWLDLMDENGIEKVFFTAWKMFSYWNKRMLVDTSIDEIYKVVKVNPDRILGLAGYNPFRIKQSLLELERAVKDYNFKGVYVHIYGFDIPLDDRKMYPLYAKCQELGTPVSMQVGYVLEAMPSEWGRPIFLDRIALDFPELKIIGSHTGYPWCEELISICVKYDNVYFGVDAHMPKYLEPTVVRYINTRGKDKVIWGSNGLQWNKMLPQINDLGLREDAKRKLMRENAIRVFKL
ncbi:MAG: amidohydrolase [Chloroflexi bacterium]|nr:amidohydrolase [Chloroflexota bacterium]